MRSDDAHQSLQRRTRRGGAAVDAGAETGETDAADEASSDAATITEAGPSGDAAVEASTDASGSSEAGCTPPTGVACDDPDVAFAGLQTGSIWITRLEANLPASALATDLALEAAPTQTPVPNVHQAVGWIDGDPCTALEGQAFRYPFGSPVGGGANGSPRGQSCALGSGRSQGDASLGILGCVVATVLAWSSRRRRRRD